MITAALHPLTVYLAGSSREHARVARWATVLERTSLVRITHRWFDTAEAWSGKDATFDRHVCAAKACEELDALACARVVWMLYPEQPSIGAFVELGAALQRRRDQGPHALRMVVSGVGCASTIFTASADFREESDEAGYYEVMRLALEQRAVAEKRLRRANHMSARRQ